ncbi:MAG: chemotaxis protein CheB [Chloroflexota bacterium]
MSKKKVTNTFTGSTYYVGVGASAGGLEALQDFFRTMPEDTGMVFIVIQHLSPDYKSMMDELLSRYTHIPIKVAEDGMQAEPNTIYLIPPRKNMSILKGKLFLEEQTKNRPLNLPVDIFFRSLAADQGKNAIGVVLSGTGSDGTLGVRSIKEAGGMVMVQDDRTAKFDGMPRSSISTGLVDFVLPAEKMPEALTNFIRHPFIEKENSLETILSKNIDTLSKIILILRDYCGIDFSYYRENTITRRLERRVSINRYNTLQEYMVFLSDSDKEKETLFRELLIGVTSFFRDQSAFDILMDRVFPTLDFSKKNLRIWSAGCSSGEEVYSIAMLLQEYIDRNKIDCTFKIFASDIDRYALEIAAQGLYPESIIADVEPDLLHKYFTCKGNVYLINEKIRKKIVFATHNLLKDPPFLKLDLLICRNLFIYLKPEMQKRLLSMFYYSLNENGYLFMGSSESVVDLNESFDTIDKKWKIYKPNLRFKPPLMSKMSLTSSTAAHRDMPMTRLNKSEKLFESLASLILPPSIILDNADNIIQLINDVNPYLRFRSGRFSQNILANLDDDLVVQFNSLLRKLKDGQREVLIENIPYKLGAEVQTLTLRGSVFEVDNLDLFLVSIITGRAAEPSAPQTVAVLAASEGYGDRIQQLEHELNSAHEKLQATIEELETSNEELQSSNEELVASNEELQSTNEELQAVNEELYTVNSEYQNKIDELTRLNNDLDNLLKNTDIGALYLDRKLCIRKITSVVYRMTNIRPTDVGRPVTHIALDNFYKDFSSDLQKVVDTLQSVEKEIEDSEGCTWIIQIRPYRSEYNAVDGIMITFIDISALKQAQLEQFKIQERLNQAMQIGSIAWWEWDLPTRQVIFDPKKATMLGYRLEDFPTDVFELVFRQM